MEDFTDAASFLAALRRARPGGHKTWPLFPLATWVRNIRGAYADMRTQKALTGRY
jgi:hypothetical protein